MIKGCVRVLRNAYELWEEDRGEGGSKTEKKEMKEKMKKMKKTKEGGFAKRTSQYQKSFITWMKVILSLPPPPSRQTLLLTLRKRACESTFLQTEFQYGLNALCVHIYT
jgi:hypothetical protein